MRIHPAGAEHEVGCTLMDVGLGKLVFVVDGGGMVAVAAGDANSTTNVVGRGVGVGGRDGAEVSASASEMPPITRMSETAPIIKPLPT